MAPGEYPLGITQYLDHGCGDRDFFRPILDLDAIEETVLGTIDIFPHEFHRHGFDLAMAWIVEEAEDAAVPLETSAYRQYYPEHPA